MPIFWSSWELWMRSSIATLQEWLCPTWSRCRTARLAEDCVEHFATSRGWNSHLTSNHNFPWFNGVLVQAPWVMTWTWAVWVTVFHFLWGACRMFDGQLFFHWESTHAWGYLSSASRPAVEKSYGQAWLPMWNSFAVVVRVAWLRWVNQAGIVGTDPGSVKLVEAVPATNTGSSRSASSDQTIIWWVGDPKAATIVWSTAPRFE